jgi:hypothetical protein
MIKSRNWLPAIVAGVLATIAATAFAGEENVVKIKFADAPYAVRKTLKREANGGKIETVDIETRDGKLVFEADVEIDGTNYEILVAKDGRLISKAIDEEEEEEDEGKDENDKEKGEKKENEDQGTEKDVTVVKFSEAPAAVQKTLKREAFGAKIVKVDIESRDGKRVYEADVEIDGKNYEILVARDGTLISKALDEEDEEKGVENEKERKKGKERKEKEDDEDDEDD